MHLHEIVQEVFSDHGALAAADADFKPREGQTQMAVAVAHTLEQGGSLVVEAGTGTGKTFAYLIPALLSGERVLVSTATKALQDQIFSRDIPVLRQALGISLHAALLKGRSSYLCPYRLELAESDADFEDPVRNRKLQHIKQWAQTTQTGDITEMPGFQERSPVLPFVTSTRENCLGNQCPSFSACFVNKARKQALAADLVVINHHLFFADMQVRESGMAELLPSVRAVIVDEAHQFNETGVQFLGQQLSSQQVVDFARDMLKTTNQLARGMAPWQELAHAVDEAAKAWRRQIDGMPNGARLNWLGEAPDGLMVQQWYGLLGAMAQQLERVSQALGKVQDSAPELLRMQERCQNMLDRCAVFSRPAPSHMVRWAEVGLQLKIFESPLDIAQTMQHKWSGGAPVSAQDQSDDAWLQGHNGAASPSQAVAEGENTAWIFTSATLGADEKLTLFTKACGLEGATIMQVASPFNYADQAALYVPAFLPKPSDYGHTQAVADFSEQAVQRLGGRTLVLTTTLKALRTIAEQLRQNLMHRDDIEVLVQGEGSKQHLMERFREGDSLGRPGCVLVASASFWEGFDAPGDSLQLVIIDKLPFPPPHDPLMQARARKIEAQGGRAFQELFVPEAAVALKQGAGRLIRRETDRGVLVVCDTRLVQMSYGKKLLQSLPPMRQLQAQPEFDAALEALKRD